MVGDEEMRVVNVATSVASIGGKRESNQTNDIQRSVNQNSDSPASHNGSPLVARIPDTSVYEVSTGHHHCHKCQIICAYVLMDYAWLLYCHPVGDPHGGDRNIWPHARSNGPCGLWSQHGAGDVNASSIHDQQLLAQKARPTHAPTHITNDAARYDILFNR